LSIWLTRKTLIAYKLALSHKEFEGEKNIEKAFVAGLTESKCLQRIMNYLFVHEKKIKADLIAHYLLERHERKDAVRLFDFLQYHGTFEFKQLDNGLFPAISASDRDDSGYQNVWVRDNIHIAYAHYQWGDKEAAARTAGALMAFFQTQRQRMQKIIQDPSLASDPMNRPHIRFDGQQLKELTQKWNHAQNDALGYFLWFYCKLAKDRMVPWTEAELACLANLVSYLRAIHYWEDKDSGHWEEVQKVSASSIGAVTAGLHEFKKMPGSDEVVLADMLTKGKSALDEILPYESRPLRRYDASLLFLIYPLHVASRNQARKILRDVKDHLEGEIGIRRYLNDSYWHPDYRKRYMTTERTKDFSDDITSRDAYINPGQEAQWCIFDPIIACIYADQPDLSPDAADRQIHYLNRSLRQLTEYPDGRLSCPEAYFLENGRYTPNDHVPLQWTQANLKLAIHLSMNTRP
jgi:phosphorylase kinase alpha/beta subunit